MSEVRLSCPSVLMIGFNRPQFLERVFAAVREAKPKQLFLALDHPRDGRPNDIAGWENCKKIFRSVDWPCEIHTNFAEVNMGCRKRIESAITWALSEVDRVIILEDDCVPCQDFFRFCGELLEKYKDDTRVGMISGHDENFHVNQLKLDGASYYFDRFTSIWGWATWRRAWSAHDPALRFWPQFKNSNKLKHVFPEKIQVDVWTKHFDGVYQETVNTPNFGTWDTGWFLTALKENWLTIHPCVNLVQNIGCGNSSRTGDGKIVTNSSDSPWQERPYGKMKYPLIHPLTMIPDIEAERYTQYDVHIPDRFIRFLRFLSKCKWGFLGISE